jgi:hypothetical protein
VQARRDSPHRIWAQVSILDISKEPLSGTGNFSTAKSSQSPRKVASPRFLLLDGRETSEGDRHLLMNEGADQEGDRQLLNCKK